MSSYRGGDIAPRPSSSAHHVSRSRRPRVVPISRGRRVLVAAVIGLAALLLVGGLVSIWADDLLLSPDNWQSTSARLLANPTVRASAATYLVDALDARVAALIAADPSVELPPAARLASPAARATAVRDVERALTQPQVRALWAVANRAAATSLIAVIDRGAGAVKSTGGAVTIDLDPILRSVADRVGLPQRLTAQLPPGVARLTVLGSQRLGTVQTAGTAVRDLALWLLVAVAILLLLAVGLARGRRRRTLLMIAAAGALAGVVVLVARSVLAEPVAGALTASPSLRRTLTAIIGICAQPLERSAAAVIAGGLVVAALAGFAGRSARERWNR
jgi:hypothetical protein